MKLLIILGYGIYQKEPLYTRYLDRALEILSSENPDLIIATGWKTNKNFPEVSEASSIKAYVVQKEPALELKIFLEESSVSTMRNILNAKELIAQQTDELATCIVVCDSIRIPKTFYLTAKYFSDLLGQHITEEDIYTRLLEYYNAGTDLLNDTTLTYQSLTVHGISWGRSIEEVSNQIMSGIIEIGCSKYPNLEAKSTKLRKKFFKIEQE